jgi:Holliday junction DNA helicase RuvA
MLSYIEGVVKNAHEQAIIVETGSWGLSLAVANPFQFEIGSKMIIHTYLHWNQEQGPTLFGFAKELDRTIFLLIISASGIGPKLALAVLEEMGPAAFLDAIATDNIDALTKVSGIGQKKAEQIIVHLRHKVTALLKSGIEVGAAGTSKHWTQVTQVLSSLNYTQTEITRTMKHLHEEYPKSSMPFDQLMRHALSFLSKHKHERSL